MTNSEKQTTEYKSLKKSELEIKDSETLRLLA